MRAVEKKPGAKDRQRRPIGRRPSREGRKTFWLMVAGAGVVALLGIAQTWTRVAVLEREYQISSAQADTARLTSELKKLQLEVATYASETPVSQEAPALAMKKATPDQVIRVTAGLADLEAPAPRSTAALAVNEGR